MQGESPKPASTPRGAVFLSYASQDAEAAERIATALRAAGVEVWFDKSELRGGDAWDQSIRKQIRTCALFLPVISKHTHERAEGYFRLEWKLAVDRSHLIMANKAFLVPVVIDETGDDDENVPERFREVQWTRLPDGATPIAFVERVSRLLSTEPAHAPAAVTSSAIAASHTAAARREATTPSAAASRRSKLVPLLIAAVALMAVGYFALDKFVLSKRSVDSLPVESAPSAIPEKSIAVLPFVDMSEKHDQEYFSDGLSEELIDLLTKVPELRVPARTSSFFFRGKSEDIAAIAQQLHVTHVLEGSVRKAANTIRVTAQLIRADNGYHLWSETYDRDLKDIFKVQDEIAGAVVAALKVRLLPRQSAGESQLGTANIEAYDQYLQGRQSFNRGDAEGYQRAVTAFTAATTLDPHYAAAYAALALAQWWHADAIYSDAAGSEAANNSALAAAEKAVALDPGLSAGYSARGFIRAIYRFDFAGGKADLDKAIALSPHDADVLHRSAVVLAINGNLPAAIAREKEAFERDPLAAEIAMRLGFFYAANQQLPQARLLYEKALAIAPNSIRALNNLGNLELFENRPEQALAVFRQSGSEGFKLAGQAKAEYSLGHVEAAQGLLKQVIAGNDPYQTAQVYAWRGENDHALDWAERAYVERDPGLTWIEIDPFFRSLHDDARYKALLRKMSLPE